MARTYADLTCATPHPLSKWQGINGFLRTRSNRANTRYMRLVRASIVLATALLGNAHADGDSLVDMLGPREIAVGEAMRGGPTGSSAIGLNPAGLPLNQELVFEGGYGYRASDDASLINASACDSTAGMPGCFFYNYAGANPDLGGTTIHSTAHIAGLLLAYPVTPTVTVGSTVKYYHVDSDVMNETGSGLSFDAGVVLRLNTLASVGASGYNLFGTNSTDLPRAAGGGIIIHAASILAFSFDSRWKLDNGDHSARYGGGAELFLRASNGQIGIPIRAGVLRDNGLGDTYLSAGLGLSGMKFSLDVAARKAVSGPDDTTFIASMRFFGPRLQHGQSSD